MKLLTLALALTLAPLPALAQPVPAAQPTPLAPGAANTPGEAPGSGPLAPLPPAPAAETPPREPASERSMAFAAGAGQCRDTVPGGPLLAIAYAVALGLMGGYVVLLARKNARLEAALTELEDELGRRRDGGGDKGDA